MEPVAPRDASSDSGFSSSRTVTDVLAAPPVLPPVHNTLQQAHHFVSLKLTTKNYLFWRTQMVPFLSGQNLLGYVDGSLRCPVSTLPATDGLPHLPNPAYAAWVQQDQFILSMLISSLSEETMFLAVGNSTSASVWLAVEQALASSSRSRSLSLLSQLQALR